jgi:hypothetical protein
LVYSSSTDLITAVSSTFSIAFSFPAHPPAPA